MFVLVGVVVLLQAVLWLSRFDESRAAADFVREHPGARVLEAVVGEGDDSAVYVHITYCRPGEREREVVWQYLHESDGRWSLRHRETLPRLGALCT